MKRFAWVDDDDEEDEDEGLDLDLAADGKVHNFFFQLKILKKLVCILTVFCFQFGFLNKCY